MRAQTTITPACAPLVIHCFSPSSRKPSATRVACVRIAPGSLPAPGSVSAKAPAAYSPEVSRGTWRRRCASLPKRAMTSPTMFVTAIVTAVAAQPRAISIMARAYATAPASAPPSSAGTFTPIRPSSARARSVSEGKRSVRSSSAAAGARWRAA